MKKYFLSVMGVLIASFAISQEKPASEWVKNLIIIDGNAKDWNLPLKYYDNDTKLFFEIKNDNNNLYLCFQSNDQMSQVKIIRAGMKISLSSKINGKHKATIYFPLPLKKDSTKVSPADEMNSDPEFSHQNMHIAFLVADSMMEVAGFTNKNGMIPSDDTSDIHAAINWDQNNTLTYEVAVPLKEMFGNDYSEKNISKNISLDVVINAFKRTGHSGNSGGNGYSGRSGGMGRGGFGGGMGHGGGMGRGGFGMGRSGNSESASAMSVKTEMKEKFTLATN